MLDALLFPGKRPLLSRHLTLKLSSASTKEFVNIKLSQKKWLIEDFRWLLSLFPEPRYITSEEDALANVEQPSCADTKIAYWVFMIAGVVFFLLALIIGAYCYQKQKSTPFQRLVKNRIIINFTKLWCVSGARGWTRSTTWMQVIDRGRYQSWFYKHSSPRKSPKNLPKRWK